MLCDDVVDPDPTGRLWFSIVFSDAPEDGRDASSSDAVCLHCVVAEHLKLGRALDLAREFGATVRDPDGEWVADPGLFDGADL